MSSILVTGGTGFVGGRIVQQLSASHDVIVSSRKPLEREVLQAHGAAGAVLHSALLVKENFPRGIDTVIHMAALNEWDCIKYPSEAIRVNIDETRIILENSIAANVQQFIYFSTAHIYGSPLKDVITEVTLPIPVHPYAITHKAAEDYVVAAALQKKIKGIVIRLSNSFGAPVLPGINRWTLLVNDLARQATEHKRLTLLSNGCQYRDFICLDDVAHAVDQMAMAGTGRFKHIVYNLGSGNAKRVLDMANAMAAAYLQLYGQHLPVVLPPGASPTMEPELHFSVDRLLEEGVEIKNEVDNALKEILVFCMKHFPVAN